jgi:hypothetical protein
LPHFEGHGGIDVYVRGMRVLAGFMSLGFPAAAAAFRVAGDHEETRPASSGTGTLG